ncbi:MAG: D-cysteine desulfhydrase [Myxococcota bacterium]|jgi:D-cysteine desulfhydrase
MSSQPQRVALARLPTPLERVDNLVDGASIFVKRDDLTGTALSGNKVRKLEYLLAEAIGQNKSRVITCGGLQSNHCRTTAVAAAKLGLKCTVFLRATTPPTDPPSGNWRLCTIVGADVIIVTPEQYQNRTQLMADHAGDDAYVIAEGGSTALGCFGYIRAFDELLAQWRSPPTSIVCAVGSGGTLAGLILGAARRGIDVPICGVNVCDDGPTFQRIVSRLTHEVADRWSEFSSVAENDVTIVEGYMGRGYALTTPEEDEQRARIAAATGHLLDPVYSGKAMRALLAEPERFGRRPLFIHTGGIFGLLA